MASPPSKINRTICHGIPDDHAAELGALLTEARRLRDHGLPRAMVLARVVAINRRLARSLPLYSPGGLVETLDVVLAEGPGGGA
jgi:hypothetical protein